jgi:hypothetical protein
VSLESGPQRENCAAFAPLVVTVVYCPIAFASVSTFRPDLSQRHGDNVVGFDPISFDRPWQFETSVTR